MNKQLQLLLKNRFISQLKLNIFLSHRDKKRRRMHWMLLILFICLAIMGVVYSVGLAYGMYLLGLGEAIPALSFTITSILTLFFTLLKANGELFQFKEYETFITLPIKTSTIIMSRFFYLYFWNVLCSMLLMLSMGSVYIVYEHLQGWFYIFWLLSIFLIPLLTTTLVAILSSLIMFLAAKFRHASLICSALTSGLLLLLLSFSLLNNNMTSLDSLMDVEKIGNQLVTELYRAYPPAQLYNRVVVIGDIKLFSLYAGGILFFFWLFIKGLSFKYKQIHANLMSVKRKNNYQVTMMKQTTQVKALYFKELKRFFASAIYVTNNTIGLIIALIMSVSLFFYGKEAMVITLDIPQLEEMLSKLAPFILSLMITLSCTSCVSLSLEGKTVWCIQSLPILKKDIYKSKILVNLTFTLPTVMICATFLSYALQVTLFEGIVLFFIPIMYAFFSAVWGIWINYKFLNYSWESETQVVKQSIASMIGMLGGMFIVIITMLPIAFVTDIFYKIYCVFIIVALGFITSILYASQIKKRI